MVREVVRNCVGWKVLAGHALAIKEDVLALEISGEVALSYDPERHVPVERSRGSIGFLDAVAIGVIGVSESGGAGDAVLRVVRVVEIGRGVVHHVPGSVIGVSAL